jgi:hypothetical protein
VSTGPTVTVAAPDTEPRMGLAAWLGSVVVDRGKTRPVVIAASVSGGLALLAASTLGMLLLTAATPLWVTTALLCRRGFALGLTVQPLVMALLDGLGARLAPDANTLFSMAERLSGSFGIALLATLYASRAAATGSQVTALHDCVLVLAAAATVGAVAAACQHGRVRSRVCLIGLCRRERPPAGNMAKAEEELIAELWATTTTPRGARPVDAQQAR